MCLTIALDKEEFIKTLNLLPETVTAYKVVRVKLCRNGEDKELRKVYPVFFGQIMSFEKHNKLKTMEDHEMIDISMGQEYMPYYHLFIDEESAISWASCSGYEILLKCEVPRDQITAIGEQSNHKVIVTKEFTFVEGDEYFKENK